MTATLEEPDVTMAPMTESTVPASVPLALRIIDQTWLYSAPKLGNWGPEITPFVPLGLTVRIVDGFSLRCEGQLSWADWKYYNRRLHLGLGGAIQW